MTESELKVYKENEKKKKGLKSLKCRPLKNFIFWLIGFISFALILVLAGFIGAKVVPIKTYLGENTNKYVSEEVGNKSLVDAVMGFSGYKVEDFPVLEDAIKNAVESGDLSTLVAVDYDALSLVSFSSSTLGNDIISCFRVIASLDAIGGTSMLGGFADLSIFKGYEQVVDPVVPAQTDVNYKQYYYDKSGANTEYVRAFNDDGTYVEGVDSTTVLFYPNLSKIPLTEFVNVFSDSFARLKAIDLLECLGGEITDSTIRNIIGDRKVSELGEISEDTLFLKDILDPATHQELFGLLGDACGKQGNLIVLKDLANMDITQIKLGTVLKKNSDNADIYKLLDAATSTDSSLLKLNEINDSFVIENIKLNVIIDVDTVTNPMLKMLAQDDTATVGNMGDKLNALKVKDVYNVSAFTTVSNRAEYCYDSANDAYYLKSALISKYGDTQGFAQGYYISSSAKGWLFVLYDTVAVESATYDSNGNALCYKGNGLTMANMNVKLSSLSNTLMNSTILQLVSAGILDGSEITSATLYAMTVQGAINALNALLP